MTKEETARNLLTELIDMIDNGSQRDLDRADEIGTSIIKLFELEPKYCDRNICVSNEYNGVGCDECEVTKSQDGQDAISRQAVLDEISDYNNDLDYTTNELYDRIKRMPSVNPQYTEYEIQKIQDLEQAEIEKAYELGKAEGQESEDAISRQAAIVALDDRMSNLENVDMQIAMGFAKGIIYDLPTVNPQQKTGHWIFDEILDKHYYCSECKSMGVDYWDFCPNCGAKMIEPQESEDKE